MLQGYNKSILTSEKNLSSFPCKRLGHDTGRPQIAVGVTFPLETAPRRHGKLPTSSPGSSGKREDPGDEVGHLLCSCATSGFILHFHNRYFWSVGNFVFHKYENQKRFLFWISPGSNTVTHELLC